MKYGGQCCDCPGTQHGFFLDTWQRFIVVQCYHGPGDMTFAKIVCSCKPRINLWFKDGCNIQIQCVALLINVWLQSFSAQGSHETSMSRTGNKPCQGRLERLHPAAARALPRPLL